LIKENMRTSAFFATALAMTLGIGAGVYPVAQAVQLSDGKVYFVQPPRLLGASATQVQTSNSNSTYYFTLSIPEDAGEPLQRVAIAQQNGGNAFRSVEYDLEDSRAFVGTRRDRGEVIPIRETIYDPDTETVSVIFEQPVPPGTTVTIGLRPDRNPDLDGLYLFGVTAYPAGESPYGQFLGYGRLQFYSPDHDFFLLR
jgi:hypothetical protein